MTTFRQRMARKVEGMTVGTMVSLLGVFLAAGTAMGIGIGYFGGRAWHSAAPVKVIEMPAQKAPSMLGKVTSETIRSLFHSDPKSEVEFLDSLQTLGATLGAAEPELQRVATAPDAAMHPDAKRGARFVLRLIEDQPR